MTEFLFLKIYDRQVGAYLTVKSTQHDVSFQSVLNCRFLYTATRGQKPARQLKLFCLSNFT